jgi:hypothetical protein
MATTGRALLIGHQFDLSQCAMGGSIAIDVFGGEELNLHRLNVMGRSMNKADELLSKPASATKPVDLEASAFPNLFAGVSGQAMKTWPDYTVDAFQRSVLFLDLLRRRGNEEIEVTSRPLATVLSFGHEVLIDGSLPRPINYTLSRIIAPPGAAVDPGKRPVVGVDPRAGQGPGVGGFKAESEIGDALNAGHPVYFIGFGATPAPGQQFLDVVEGQVRFFERVVELHPDAPRPFAIGNCQAGYQDAHGGDIAA